MSIEKLSHEAHSGWYEVQYATREAQEKAIADWKYDATNNTINHWLHNRLLTLVNPLLKEKKELLGETNKRLNFIASQLIVFIGWQSIIPIT